ncbi:MAG: hypothetical protein WCJ30_16185, partial [Deltaproteobacteria bacterium]
MRTRLLILLFTATATLSGCELLVRFDPALLDGAVDAAPDRVIPPADVQDVHAPDVLDVIIVDATDASDAVSETVDVVAPDVTDVQVIDAVDTVIAPDVVDVPAADACPAGQITCGASCVNTGSDPLNCGACGATCTDGTCTSGSCICPSGLTACGGACIGCAGGSCTAGACVCPAGRLLCLGICVLNDALHCGTCANVCTVPASGTATCTAGTCGLACNTGFHLCGTTCSSNTSPSSCGTSCTPCTPPTATNCSGNIVISSTLPATCTAGTCGFGTGMATCTNGCFAGACVATPLASLTGVAATRATIRLAGAAGAAGSPAKATLGVMQASSAKTRTDFIAFPSVDPA